LCRNKSLDGAIGKANVIYSVGYFTSRNTIQKNRRVGECGDVLYITRGRRGDFVNSPFSKLGGNTLYLPALDKVD